MDTEALFHFLPRSFIFDEVVETSGEVSLEEEERHVITADQLREAISEPVLELPLKRRYSEQRKKSN